jgi:hypothetical protein
MSRSEAARDVVVACQQARVVAESQCRLAGNAHARRCDMPNVPLCLYLACAAAAALATRKHEE